jgi:hypothetical protein
MYIKRKLLLHYNSSVFPGGDINVRLIKLAKISHSVFKCYTNNYQFKKLFYLCMIILIIDMIIIAQ